MIFLIWIAVLIAAVVIYYRQIYSTFKKNGIKNDTPLPLLGNSWRVLLRLDHVADDMLKLYKKFPEERFVGRYEFTNELVLIQDPELVKQITVKDFEHFVDHRSLFSEGDSFFNRNLLALKGQEWKDMRSTLSPAFTSSKIRAMVPFMVEISDQIVTMLKKKSRNQKLYEWPAPQLSFQITESTNDVRPTSRLTDTQTDYDFISLSVGGFIEVDCKDLTTRYANDVIASCAYGLKVDSHADPKNQFYLKGKQSTTFGYFQMLLFIIVINLPRVAKFFKLDFMPKGTKEFFSSLVLDTMKNREENHIVRPDMIHLLMEAKNGKLTHEAVKPNDVAAGFATVEESNIGRKVINKVWSDRDLISQAMLFFIAGFETVSATMTFLLYELALNTDVQDRLVQEIKEHDTKNGHQFDFNSIQNMTYLDMVISELLRLWPPAIGLDRECIKDYNLGKPNKNAKKDYIIRKGTGIGIPSYAFHRDPRYFPNPEKFDPERFSEENKHKINPFAYIPFGIGPRNCIGSRFALCEVKVLTYQILLHMEVSPTETTCIPAKLSAESFNFRLQGGHNLRFRLRA